MSERVTPPLPGLLCVLPQHQTSWRRRCCKGVERTEGLGSRANSVSALGLGLPAAGLGFLVCKGRGHLAQLRSSSRALGVVSWTQGHRTQRHHFCLPLKPMEKSQQVAPLMEERSPKTGKTVSQVLLGLFLFLQLQRYLEGS